MSEQKTSKVNTVLLSVCMVMLSALGMVARDTQLKADTAATEAVRLRVSLEALTTLTAGLMPRLETEGKLGDISRAQDKLGRDLYHLGERVSAVEMAEAAHGWGVTAGKGTP